MTLLVALHKDSDHMYHVSIGKYARAMVLSKIESGWQLRDYTSTQDAIVVENSISWVVEAAVDRTREFVESMEKILDKTIKIEYNDLMVSFFTWEE